MFYVTEMDNFHHAVLDALTKASSQNAELLKDAERQLKSWETNRGFYSTLLNIACDKSIDVNIRWLSVLCLKNGIERYWWRPFSAAQRFLTTQTIQEETNYISLEEKALLKQKLLTCLNEPVSQIALQFAVIISKIARYDFPKDWPDLFPTLLNGTQSTEQLLQLRALLTMHHVVKALASKRLTFDRKIFQQLTSTIFANILQMWINYSKLFLQEAQSSSPTISQLLESSLLTLKMLRKLLVYGKKDGHKDEDATNFLSLIFQQIIPFLDCRATLRNRGTLVEMSEKYLVLLVKILCDTLEFQPKSFVQFIRPALECSVTICFNKDYEGRLFERLIVQLLNLIKGILLSQEYKPSKNAADENNPVLLEAHKIKMDFFSYPVLCEIFQQLLSRYFLLSEIDVSSWENNPEEFASDEGGESWKFSLRPCTEVFFLSLFHEFRNLLTPLIVEMIKNMQNISARDDIDILRRDAVYNAVGLAAFDLYDEVDFDVWFTNVLIPELRNKNRGYYIIRRRVVWLIGRWVGVKMSPEMRPLLYEIVLELLNNEEDLVVRLAAANTLKSAVDDFEFNYEQFLPYLKSSIASLFHLLKEVKECDLKMSVLHVLSFIVERMGSEVRPFTDSLMQYLPELWGSCGDHNMLRCAIITCFIFLVRGLGTMSESLHSFLLPMIALSTDVSQPPHVYLLEDGLNLWWEVIDNTSSCSPELLDLARNMMPLLEYNGENLRICLQITKGYIILSPQTFLKRYGQELVKTFVYAITDLKPEGINMMLRVVETAFIVFPEDGPVLFQPILPFVLSLALQTDELPISLAIYLSILSRVILHNQNCFRDVLQEKASEYQKDVNTVLSELLDRWLEKMSYFNPVQRRKLMGLALTCLLTSGSDVVYDRICGIFLNVVEVLNDITLDGDTPSVDVLVAQSDDQVSDDNFETEHDKRKRDLSKIDPVYNVVLLDYLYNQVMALQQSVGAVKFQDLMSTVDIETMQQLQRYLRKV